MPNLDISAAQFVLTALCIGIAAWYAVNWIDSNVTLAGLYALAGSM
jgi:hypothetical protein